MGYIKENGQWADTEDVTLASGVLTATAEGAAVAAGHRYSARLTLDVTGVSGTSPTLDAVIETSEDKVTWTTVGSFAQATAVSKQRKVFSGLDRYVRAKETLGGSDTPTVTRTIKGELV